MLEAGAAAPAFELEDLNGGTRTLRDIAAGKPVLLAFFKVSCPTCQFTFPFLERMYRAGKGSVGVYAISQDDAASTSEFNQEFGISMPTLLDRAERGYPASNAYGLTHVPSLFLVEPDGRISWTSNGFHKQELEELGRRTGVAPFKPSDYVPEWKSG